MPLQGKRDAGNREPEGNETTVYPRSPGLRTSSLLWMSMEVIPWVPTVRLARTCLHRLIPQPQRGMLLGGLSMI